jgi:hypothetical protein
MVATRLERISMENNSPIWEVRRVSETQSWFKIYMSCRWRVGANTAGWVQWAELWCGDNQVGEVFCPEMLAESVFVQNEPPHLQR